MQKCGLVTLILIILICKEWQYVYATGQESYLFGGLLKNETNSHESQFDQEEFSGNFNESDSSGYGQDFGNQLQIPTDLEDIVGDDLETERTSKWTEVFSGSGYGMEHGQVKKNDHQPPIGRTGSDSDLYMESSGDSQLESQLTNEQTEDPNASGDYINPLTKRPLGHVPPRLFDVEPKITPCEERLCSSDNYHKIKIVSASGNVIPSAVEMVLQCTIHGFTNDSVKLTWSLPETVEGMETALWTDLSRFNQSEVITDRLTTNERIISGVFRLYNVSELDSGLFHCQAVFSERCCYLRSAVNMKVYTPPSMATDIAIVLGVCFIEFILIIYFKTRSEKKCIPRNDRSALSYQQLQAVQNKT